MGTSAYLLGMKMPIKVYVVTLIAAAGLAVGCNQSVESNSQAFNTLPPAVQKSVQKTIQAHAPESQIADIERHSDNGRVIYEVSFQDTGKNPSIKVAEDGTLVQSLQK